MTKVTNESNSLMLRIKDIAAKFTAIIIVGLLLAMPHASCAFFVSHNLKNENQEITKTSIWSAAAKTIDLYLRPFSESSIKQSYSEKPLIKKLPSAFIKNIIKSYQEIHVGSNEYIAYSETAAQVLDKTYIFFPFHYFW